MMSGRREVKEFISPLLQPPLNRLFIPRVTPEYLPPLDRDTEERQWVKVMPTAHYMHLLSSTKLHDVTQQPPKTATSRKERMHAQKVAHRVAIEEQLNQCIPSGRYGTWWSHPRSIGDPSKYPPEKTTEDPFKTLFVARLPYDLEEAKLRREFERFGPIRTVKIIKDMQGASRGEAFVEFERERDMKLAFIEADGMRIDGSGRRILVDIERGRTIKDWRPRRFGGGLGRTRAGPRELCQKHSGRDPRANEMLMEQMMQAVGGNARRRSPSPRGGGYGGRRAEYHHREHDRQRGSEDYRRGDDRHHPRAEDRRRY